MDDFDRFVDALQKEIDLETRRDFSDRVVKLGSNPENWGRMEDANVHARYTGPCGDTMEFYLMIDDGVITKISFMTNGCAPSIASGSQATLLALGKTVDEVMNIESSDILGALGRLPESHHHCPELARRTLHLAIEKYKEG
ncbi:iron-sulfur cluster assembly scaffold protein [Candidatus Bathyarchaeota archaeon]|nr:iron-sulfur cluster assembly scaffold protein [Candidatus Bathyarchaeota archaeon]